MSALLYMVAGAAVVGGAAWFATRGKREREARLKAREEVVTGAVATNDIKGVTAGGVLKIPGFGPQLVPVETHVVHRHKVVDDEGIETFALECEQGTRALTVEWSLEGGDLYVTAGYEDDNPRLSDLGLTEDDLIRFDDQERGEFEWDGTRWIYEFSGEMTWYEQGKGKGEGYYTWEFESDKGDRYISIEKWERDRGFGVYQTWTLDPEEIEVFSTGKGA